jgi:hypothetical protein
MTGTPGVYNADNAQFVISPTASDALTSEGSQQSSCYVKDVPVLLSQGIECPQSLDDLVCPIQRCEEDDLLNESLLFQAESADFPGLLTGIALEDGPFPLDTLTPTDFPESSSPRHAGSEIFTSTPPPTLLSLRFPVLQPLLPFIQSTISAELACGLLDFYFTSAFPGHMHPICHHIHCYVVRKDSFLDEIRPRPSSTLGQHVMGRRLRRPGIFLANFAPLPKADLPFPPLAYRSIVETPSTHAYIWAAEDNNGQDSLF